MHYIPICFCHISHLRLYITKCSPNTIAVSRAAMISPSATETAMTAPVCFVTVSLSGQMILLYSAFKPFQKLFLGAFFGIFCITHFCPPKRSGRCPIAQNQPVTLTSSLCVTCVSYRICSTFWFPFCPDEFSYPLSCCNYAACILCMPV